jgi:hypothetical protein
LECARLVAEAQSKAIERDSDSREAANLRDALNREFYDEVKAWSLGKMSYLSLDSIYLSAGGISGRPLTDSYHFGTTIVNDYGRPFGEGLSGVAGVSGSAVRGRFALYFRGEYQHAPEVPDEGGAARALVALRDHNPVLSSNSEPEIDQVRVVEAYAIANVNGFQLAFGKRALYWGPTESGPFLYSSNAEPVYMVSLDRVIPAKLPSLLEYLGPMRIQGFVAKLAGHTSPAHPYLHGEKISFKPTENLELGFSRSVVFGGEGHPLTIGSFGRSYFSLTSNTNDPRADPGDRRGGFDFSYRLPFARRWLTLYSDSLVDDDPSPLAAPRRAAINPGIYLSHFPKLNKLDLRVEASSTDVTTSISQNGEAFYWNNVYRDSYTNKGRLLGNPMGREAKGMRFSSTYWLTAENKILFTARSAKTASDFIDGGGTQQDFSFSGSFRLRLDYRVNATVQIERWRFPILLPRTTTNIAALVGMVFEPHWRK